MDLAGPALREALERAVSRGAAKLGDQKTAAADRQDAQAAQGRATWAQASTSSRPGDEDRAPARTTYSSVASSSAGGGRSKRITPTPSNVPIERKRVGNSFFASAVRTSDVQQSLAFQRRRMFEEITEVEVPPATAATSRTSEGRGGADGADGATTVEATAAPLDGAGSNSEQRLNELATRCAREHALSLVSGRVPNVHNELRLLFEAIGLHGIVDASSLQMDVDAAGSGVKCYAPAYSCRVLEEASDLTLEMGERALEAMAESAAVRAFSPALRDRVAAKIESIKSNRNRYKHFYDELPSTSRGQPAYLRRPMVLPGGETRPLNMMPDEAKRLKNREEARDAFVAILGNLQDFLSKQDLLNSKIDRDLNRPGSASPGANRVQGKSGGSHGDYEALHTKVKSFVTTLHLDNIRWFSQLFMERILQTASMGEMDEEVVVLANADPSKMRRLHQRMTLSHSRGKTQRGTLGVPDYAARSQKAQENFSSAAHRGHHRGSQASQLNGASGMELMRTILIHFPINLRIYALFLLIADSQRMAEELEAKMQRRLFDIATWVFSLPLPQDVSERVLSCKALALFLGYFAFSCKDKACVFPEDVLGFLGGKSGEEGGHWGFLRHASTLDLRELMESSLSLGTLPFTLPWIADYLRFGAYAKEPCREDLRRALATVWHIRSKTFSLGKNEDKGGATTAALCVRISIDLLFEEWRIDVQSENVRAFFASSEKSKISEMDLDFGLANKAMDRKCVQACCPELEDLAGMMDRSSLSRMKTRKSSRKITPVSPANTGGGPPGPQGPHSFTIDGDTTLRAALLGTEESEDQRKRNLTLQRAMLDRYAHLKTIIDFVVDAVARNAVSDVIDKSVRKECAKILDQQSEVARFAEERFTNQCYRDIAVHSFATIKAFVTDKVQTALKVLIPRDIDAEVAACACEIGTEASLITAAKTLLDRIPLEYQKCVKEKIKALTGTGKKKVQGPLVPGAGAASWADIPQAAQQVMETFRVNGSADTPEEVGKKIWSIALALNSSVKALKAQSFPKLPQTDTYHPLWKANASMPDAFQLLGYVWTNLVGHLACAMGEGEGERLFACLRSMVLDGLDLGSKRPFVHFAKGAVANFADTCCFFSDGVVDAGALRCVETCAAKLVTSLLSSGLLRPQCLQEILVTLLRSPKALRQYYQAKEQVDLSLHKEFVSKCLESGTLSKSDTDLYFAPVAAILSPNGSSEQPRSVMEEIRDPRFRGLRAHPEGIYPEGPPGNGRAKTSKTPFPGDPVFG